MTAVGVDFAPTVQQYGLAVRRPLFPGKTTLSHIGKLKAHNSHTLDRQLSGDGRHKITVHRRTGTVGQDQ
jgi:hypothetical protein